MDTAIQPATHRAAAAEFLRAVPITQTLSVAAIYNLSEEGRKISLLAGGDGKAVQRLTLHVPSTRLHLVSVDVHGVARLKLHPRFERVDGQEVVRSDGPPTYDVPPSIEDLFKEAARNHELEREYRSNRSLSRDRRRDADRDRRLKLAEEFLSEPSQRAMVHPVPTPKRCFMATASGRVMFDAATDVGPARDVPREAYRRFRADLRARKAHNLKLRAEQLALHDEKTRVIAEWVCRNGSEDQRGRHAAGLLPVEEIIDALTDEAFATVADVPRYPLDGTARLEEHLRAVTGRPNTVVSAADLHVVGVDATAASAAQWAVIQQLESRLPDADVTLREHRLSWRRDPALPGLSAFGVLVTRQVGPFILRREFAVPER
jgi:hypothetical protein